jgi:hypothetical protein
VRQQCIQIDLYSCFLILMLMHPHWCQQCFHLPPETPNLSSLGG